ncbi:MAG: hypothetical protein FWF59_12955 [Turicibacter sp.]|nr:hypothetical protein [Turicibacter sp.]
MDMGKRTPIGAGDYLDGIHEWSREKLYQMGVEVDYLDDAFDRRQLPPKRSPRTKWFMLGTLGLFVAIIAYFGNTYHHETPHTQGELLLPLDHTAQIYEGHQV